jgi:hypothetical protein
MTVSLVMFSSTAGLLSTCVPMMHLKQRASAQQSSQQAQQATSTIHWNKRSKKTLFLPALGNARSGLKYLERNVY